MSYITIKLDLVLYQFSVLDNRAKSSEYALQQQDIPYPWKNLNMKYGDYMDKIKKETRYYTNYVSTGETENDTIVVLEERNAMIMTVIRHSISPENLNMYWI